MAAMVRADGLDIHFHTPTSVYGELHAHTTPLDRNSGLATCNAHIDVRGVSLAAGILDGFQSREDSRLRDSRKSRQRKYPLLALRACP